MPFHFWILIAHLHGAPDEGAALERYRKAEAAKEQAFLALEQSYARMEDEVTRWRLADRQHATPLDQALQELLAALAHPMDHAPTAAAEDPLAARLARRQRQELCQREIAVLLQSRVDAVQLNELIAERCARLIVEAGERDVTSQLRTALEPMRSAAVPFHELWNAHFYLRSPEAREYSDRYNEYVAAGVELDRVRHPDQYLPGGKKVRAGMVYIPGGTYRVGPNTGFERRRRNVTVRPLLMDEHEVTNAQYLTYLEALPAEQRAVAIPSTWAPDPRGVSRYPEGRDSHPVAGVTWRQANAYARWAGKRLPTEDEWEIACRGREGHLYPWGDEFRENRCNEASLALGDTVAVGTFPEDGSPFGVHELAGNVEEWTATHEDGEVISNLSSNIAPIVVRGGHFLSSKENVSAVFRWVAPGGSSREAYLGFRCAADLE